MNFTKIILFEKDQPITDFAAARNKLLQEVKGEWVLFLDTDEKISPELEKEILNLEPKFDGYYLKRNDYFFGKWLKFGETANVRLLRLGRDGHWQGRVHEAWQIVGQIGELKNPLLHYPHKNIYEFINKINHYTTIAATNKKFRYRELFYPLGKFIQNYFFRLGFLDGKAGFVMAYMMSLHSLIVRVKSYDSVKTI